MVESARKKGRPAPAAASFYDLEKARTRANNALLLALGSFVCPGVGIVLAVAAILMGLNARRMLMQANIQEGQGMATAGVVIGSISLVAQICYIIYFLKAGFAF